MPYIYTHQHKIYPKVFPESWASSWGEDEHGIWMEFTYKEVTQRFRWCEPGTFLMGSPEDESERNNDETQYTVILTKGFWIADTPVTQALWETVMLENPSIFKSDNRPVGQVSWSECEAFINQLNQMKQGLNLALPTEAQWEYACRAGTTTPFYWGKQIDATQVNFNSKKPYSISATNENRQATINAKSLPSNNWGLFQMHGNIWEWCQDWYSDYPNRSVSDPMNIESGSTRVLRGGSWVDSARHCRSANRSFDIPGAKMGIGFRLARTP